MVQSRLGKLRCVNRPGLDTGVVVMISSKIHDCTHEIVFDNVPADSFKQTTPRSYLLVLRALAFWALKTS